MGIGVGVYSGRAAVAYRLGGRGYSAMATRDAALPSGWHHVAAVRGGRRLRLLLDGRLVASSATFDRGDYPLAGEEPLLIGGGEHATFRGSLCDLRLYDRALEDTEVASLARLA